MEPPLPERLNEDIAGRLEEVAQLLAAQGASRFRVRAYQRAAETVRRLWFHRRDREGRLAQAALSDRFRSAPSPSRPSPNRSTCPWSRCSQYSQAAPSIGSDSP
jgi:Helix-hairpin-helix domain